MLLRYDVLILVEIQFKNEVSIFIDYINDIIGYNFPATSKFKYY